MRKKNKNDNNKKDTGFCDAAFDLNLDGKFDPFELLVMEEEYIKWKKKEKEKGDPPDVQDN